MVNLIRWIDPDSAFGWTYVRIERGAAVSGPFTELTSADIAGYTASGLALGTTHITQAKDNTGVSGQYYRLRFFDGTNYSDYADPMMAFGFRGYCTIEEVRSFTNLQAAEYPDGQLQLIIDGVTADIDGDSGRTWQGIQTVTDQLLDGTGNDILVLPEGDIQTVTSLTVDTDMDGVFDTTITLASDVFIYYTDGYICLNKNQAPIKNFPTARQSIKISYTWGNATVPNDLRHLALLMVAQVISVDATRQARIDQLRAHLARRNFQTV